MPGTSRCRLRNAARSIGVGFQFLTGRALFLSLMNECTPEMCPEGSYRDLAKRLKAVSKPGDVVVLSFARDRFEENGSRIETFRRNLTQFIGELESGHLRVVFVEDIPKVCAGDAAYVQSAFRKGPCEVPAAESRRGRGRLSRIYRGMGSENPVTIIDPHDLLCEKVGDQQKCSNWLGSELLYLDSSPHLTLRAANSLTGFLRRSFSRYAKGTETGKNGKPGILCANPVLMWHAVAPRRTRDATAPSWLGFAD